MKFWCETYSKVIPFSSSWYSEVLLSLSKTLTPAEGLHAVEGGVQIAAPFR